MKSEHKENLKKEIVGALEQLVRKQDIIHTTIDRCPVCGFDRFPECMCSWSVQISQIIKKYVPMGPKEYMVVYHMMHANKVSDIEWGKVGIKLFSEYLVEYADLRDDRYLRLIRNR